MEFDSVPLSAALGAILAYGVRVGERRFKKGRVLSAADLAEFAQAGIPSVTVARLGSGDVGEDAAAERLAARCAGKEVRTGAAFTGRVNLYAQADGVALIEAAAVAALNAIDEAITIATLPAFSRVAKGQMLATIKIIPFAAPRAAVERGEKIVERPLVAVAPFAPHRAALISTALPGTRPSLLDKNRAAISDRLSSLGSQLTHERRVPHAVEPLTTALAEAVAGGTDPILVFGASAITDRRDVIPAAIVAAGGEVVHFGMPVDPGNLLLLGRLAGRTVIGLPSCARSPKLNGFDFVLWRILAGLPVGRKDIAAMGVGGLLTEIPSRPQPRDERPAAHLPKIAAIVLAAGLGSRMGLNKLLEDVGGKPLVRHAVEAALGSAASPVLVVIGNGGSAVRQALTPLQVTFVDNPDYSKGLSSSLKCGLKALSDDCDAAMVMLGDMPGVTSALVDKLIAAFDPGEGRAICIATRAGRRGNPVLWARRFFPEMLAIEGDVGARQLIGPNEELVCEVEAGDDGPITDIDTPEALTAYRAASRAAVS